MGLMHNQTFYLPIYYMAQIKEQLDFWQLDSAAWLQHNHITANQLTSFEETIDFTTYEALIRSAIALSKNDALGLYIGERIGLTSHGLLGFALLNCSSIKEAITIAQDYINTRTPFISIEIVETSEDFIIIFNEIMSFETVKNTFLEAVFVTFHNILSQLTFDALKLSAVHLNYAKPHYSKLYSKFFDCPVKFHQTKNEMRFAASMLNIPLRLSDPISLKQARQLCDAELTKMANNNITANLSIRVKEILLNSVGHFPTLKKTATRLHMTPRTLHRHLKREGACYSLLLENVSHTIATQQLINTNITVAEISLLLGYIDVANFRRAFKRWTGMTPSDYRTNNDS
jgi:AraC-like DNA-binding protein